MIVSCGEALVDMVPHPVAGGAPFNVAVAAARLGVPAAFVGGISTDQHGEMLLDHLRANGVDVSVCQRFEAPTARAIVEHTPRLRFRFEGDGTADTLLAEADLSALTGGPHILHAGALGLFRGTTASTLVDLAERHEGLVSLDPNVRPEIIDDRDIWMGFHDRWLAVTDVYKGSDEDLDWIWPGRSALDTAEELLSAGIGVVIVTRGSDGITVVTADGDAAIPAPKVEVVDTVGAGDSLIASVLASLVELGADRGREHLDALGLATWVDVADRAVQVAAITCTRVGADTPHRHEFDWPDLAVD